MRVTARAQWSPSAAGNLGASLAFVVFFEDVKRVAMVQLHADGAEDSAHRAGGAALFPDDFAYVLRRNAEFKNGIFVAVDRLNFNGRRLIYECPRDFADQLVNLDRILGHDLASDLLAFSEI
jgi:hypothetical protein